MTPTTSDLSLVGLQPALRKLGHHDFVLLNVALEWALKNKASSRFRPLTFGGNRDGHFGEWDWTSARGARMHLCVPMGHRSSLLTCSGAEGEEIFCGVWNRVLEEWNDVVFLDPVGRGWLFAEFGIPVHKPWSRRQTQRARIAWRRLRRFFFKA
jgi:hypothetical protein